MRASRALEKDTRAASSFCPPRARPVAVRGNFITKRLRFINLVQGNLLHREIFVTNIKVKRMMRGCVLCETRSRRTRGGTGVRESRFCPPR